MDSTFCLSPDALRTYHRWHRMIALLLLALLVILPFFGIDWNSWKNCIPAAAPTAAAPVVATPAPAAPSPAPTAAPDAETIPAAKVYFALDTWDLPTDAPGTLANVVAYLKSHASAKALVSGFHDPRGSVARNEELALNRARQVRAALEAAGIVRERIVMNKPQVTTGTGSNEEARRVEVTIQ